MRAETFTILALLSLGASSGAEARRAKTEPPRVVKNEQKAAATQPNQPAREPRAAAKDKAQQHEPSVKPTPPAPAATEPAHSETQASWSDAEIIAAQAHCMEALAPIKAEVRIASPVRQGQCGNAVPLVVKSIGTGITVMLTPPVEINCDIVVALHRWLEQNAQPSAREVFGEDIVGLTGVGYQCRPRAGGSKMSEHATANAIDIMAFRLRSGREITVLDNWGPIARERQQLRNFMAPSSERSAKADGRAPKGKPSDPQASKGGRTALGMGSGGSAVATREIPSPTLSPPQRFLRRLHAEACGPFTTVLGPEANADGAVHRSRRLAVGETRHLDARLDGIREFQRSV